VVFLIVLFDVPREANKHRNWFGVDGVLAQSASDLPHLDTETDQWAAFKLLHHGRREPSTP
jgi:hypothetical protein